MHLKQFYVSKKVYFFDLKLGIQFYIFGSNENRLPQDIPNKHETLSACCV